jgi:hypothetical protein
MISRVRDLVPVIVLQRSFRIAFPVCFLLLLFPAGCVPADEMTSTILVGNSRIDVHVEKRPLQLSNQDLMQWVRSAADSVSAYYGRYPVPNVLLRIAPTDGKGVRGGRTFGKKDGGSITIHVGIESTIADLNSDWMLTHEMVHLAFPSMADDHHWVEEGIATYVEPIARVRAKHLDAHEMWFELVRDLHQGLPAPGDKGLDNTHTWGRTYWGGALFCFLADIEIHKQTNNRKGLDDALRGILNAGGDIRYDWPIEKALSVGDHSTGAPVLLPLYEKMKSQPYDVDLAALWKELGVERDGNTIDFVDSAPLAKTRDAITYGAPAVSASETQPAFASPAIFAGRRSRTLR